MKTGRIYTLYTLIMVLMIVSSSLAHGMTFVSLKAAQRTLEPVTQTYTSPELEKTVYEQSLTPTTGDEPIQELPQARTTIPDIRTPELPSEEKQDYTLPGDISKVGEPEISNTDDSSSTTETTTQSMLERLQSQMKALASTDFTKLAPQIVDDDPDVQLAPEQYRPELKFPYENLPRPPEYNFPPPEPLYIPDVTVSGLKTPYKVNLEEEFQVSFLVQNSNKGTGTMRVALFDGQSTNPVKVWQVTLQGNDEIPFTYKHKYKAVLFDLGGRPARYQMKVVANYQEQMIEYNIKNNEATANIIAYQVPKTTDIQTSIDTTGATPTVGEEVEFMVFMANTGNLATGEFGYQVNFGDGEKYLSTTGLRAGQARFIRIKHTYTSAGNYGVILTADTTDAVLETDEDNNYDKMQVSVTENIQETPNRPPYAHCELSPTTGEVPFNVTAECGYSSDSDGYIAVKRLTVEGPDGVRQIQEAIDMIYPFSVEMAGDYVVTLDIEDNEGATAQWTGTVAGGETQSHQDSTDSTNPSDPNNSTNTTDPSDPQDPTDPVDTVFGAELTITPDTGYAPLDVVIDGSGSTGTITEHTWSITGPNNYTYVETGIPGAPGTLNLTFEDAGVYTVRLHIFGQDGSEIVYYNVVVEDAQDPTDPTDPQDPADPTDPQDPTDPSDPSDPTDPSVSTEPVAVISATPDSGDMPLHVLVSGEQSYDPDGSIIGYSWIIDGPGITYMDLGKQGTPGNLEFDFQEAGDYRIKLVVADNEENADSDEITVTVLDPEAEGQESGDENQAPVPVVSASPATGETPLNVTFSGEQSHDDDGEIVSHSWIITGANYSYTDIDAEGMPGTLDLELDEVGEYTVQLVVTDDDGAAMDITTTVTVTEASDDGNNTDDGTDDGNNDGDNSSDDYSNDTSDNTSNNTNQDLETPDISHIDVKAIKFDSARIEWETSNVKSDSEVCYGTDQDNLDDCENNNDLVNEHKIELENLDEKTKYYYTVKSCNANEECDEEGPFHFTTLVEDNNSDDNNDDWENNYNDEWADFQTSTEDLVSSSRANSQGSTSGNSDQGSEPVVEEPSVDVIYAAPQYIEVEEEQCKLKFLWWCVWKETVMKKIPLPNIMGGVEFEI